MFLGLSNLSTFLNYDDDAYVYYDNDKSSDDNDVVPLLTTTERHFIVVILIVAFVIGLYANTRMIFMAFARIKKGVLNWIYVFNIAIVHNLVLVACVPAAAVTIKLSTWPFGNVMCKLTNYLMTVCVTVDVISLVAIVTENYNSIRSILRKPFGTKRKAALTLLVVWCVSLFTMTPRLTLYKVQDLLVVEEVRHVCTRNFGPIAKRQADTCLLFIFHYLAPALLIATCSIGSHRKLAKFVQSGVGDSDFFGNDIKEAKGIIRVSSAIGLTYLIGWLPVHVTSFLQEFYDYDVMSGREIYTFCLFLATFTICPIVVIVCRPEVHQEEAHSSSLQVLKEDSSSSVPSNR